MFTIEQIKEAHSKVKSGADFPRYVQELKALRVSHYDNYVTDGHTDYRGYDGYSVGGPAKYQSLEVALTVNKPVLEHDLKAHQDGRTDYATFCRRAAEAGVWKWTVDLEKMACTYYERSGNAILAEVIPAL